MGVYRIWTLSKQDAFPKVMDSSQLGKLTSLSCRRRIWSGAKLSWHAAIGYLMFMTLHTWWFSFGWFGAFEITLYSNITNCKRCFYWNLFAVQKNLTVVFYFIFFSEIFCCSKKSYGSLFMAITDNWRFWT